MPAPIDDLRLTIDEMLRWVRPAWHADAACHEHPELSWFPERGESVVEPRAVCDGCLVRCECRSAGIDGREQGLWGGLSERNRRQLRSSVAGAAA